MDAKSSTLGTPLNDYLLVRRIKAEEKTKGGIVIPDKHSERPLEALVLAVGRGRILESGQRVPCDVKAGDKVLFSKFSGSEIKLGGEDYLMLREQECLMILPPE